jgi:glycosyltransferase involved in cell wall biosynthesis
LFLRKLPRDLEAAEVILVENGSTDGTLQVCRRLHHRFPIQVKVCTIARGSYGEAIKEGIRQSTGTHLSILECDCLDLEFVCHSIDLIRRQNARFIVASKRHPDAIDGRPWKRRFLTGAYNKLLHVYLRYPGSDTHGLKTMETSLGKQLCDISITSDEILQTEIVLLAWRLGVKIEELPLNIRECRPAPVRVVKRLPKVINTLRELQRSLARFPDESLSMAESPLTNCDAALQRVAEAGGPSDAELVVNTQWK